MYYLSNSTSTTANNWATVTSSTASNYLYLTTDDGDVHTLTWNRHDRRIVIPDGREREINLPDGTVIKVNRNGSFEICDKDAKVTYRANRVRDFNPFINASDKIEEFIRFCGQQGVRQGEILGMPLNLFITWLIVEAAKADQEPEPDMPLLSDLRRTKTPRCLSCGQFIHLAKKQRKIEFCATRCFDRYQMKVAA